MQAQRPTSTISASPKGATPGPAARREELERLRLMGMLVANVAHEINNHLSYLLGNLERVNRRLPQLRAAHHLSAEDELESDLEGAVDGAMRIADIVRSLSTFARGDVRVRQVDPLCALDTALRLATERIAGRARLVLALAPLPLVDANESQLSQVLLNLLLNAADAIPLGAPDAHEIRVRSYVQPDAVAVAIEIEDTGQGIAADSLERIFEPFYTTKPLGLGTGLGLSVSRDLMDGMGGTISVTSRPGRGSTFRVALPVRAGREAAAPPAGD